jgi:ATP-dependent Clp protease ATP-binding subunit ClpX
MYELPVRDDIGKCIITKDVILNHEKPILVTADKRKKKKEESA